MFKQNYISNWSWKTQHEKKKKKIKTTQVMKRHLESSTGYNCLGFLPFWLCPDSFKLFFLNFWTSRNDKITLMRRYECLVWRLHLNTYLHTMHNGKKLFIRSSLLASQNILQKLKPNLTYKFTSLICWFM